MTTSRSSTAEGHAHPRVHIGMILKNTLKGKERPENALFRIAILLKNTETGGHTEAMKLVARGIKNWSTFAKLPFPIRASVEYTMQEGSHSYKIFFAKEMFKSVFGKRDYNEFDLSMIDPLLRNQIEDILQRYKEQDPKRWARLTFALKVVRRPCEDDSWKSYMTSEEVAYVERTHAPISFQPREMCLQRAREALGTLLGEIFNRKDLQGVLEQLLGRTLDAYDKMCFQEFFKTPDQEGFVADLVKNLEKYEKPPEVTEFLQKTRKNSPEAVKMKKAFRIAQITTIIAALVFMPIVLPAFLVCLFVCACIDVVRGVISMGKDPIPPSLILRLLGEEG